MEVEVITAVRVCDPLKVHQASGREGAQEELVPLMGGWRAPLRRRGGGRDPRSGGEHCPLGTRSRILEMEKIGGVRSGFRTEGCTGKELYYWSFSSSSPHLKRLISTELGRVATDITADIHSGRISELPAVWKPFR